MISDYFVLSLKNLKKRGLRSWLTMLGIFIGIAAVVSLISLGQGLQETITGQFSTLDADKLIVENTGTGFGPPGSTSVKKLNEEDIKIIERVIGVKEAIPRLVRVDGIELNKIRKFNFVASVPEDENQIGIITDALNVELEAGRFLSKDDFGKVVLGNDFLEEERFDKEIRVGEKLKIQGEVFETVGILKRGSSFQINSVVLMLERDLERILDIEGEIDLIIVQVEDEDRIEEVTQSIERDLRKKRDQKIGEEDFSVQTPLQAISAIDTILSVINLTVVGIAALSLIVGGIGIANTMYTSVLERTKEIGVMKAIGAKNSDILSIFLIESGLLGIVGGVIGTLIGTILAFGFSFVAGNSLGGLEFKVNFSLSLIILAILFSLLIGIISGTIPAIRASKLSPMEALRK